MNRRTFMTTLASVVASAAVAGTLEQTVAQQYDITIYIGHCYNGNKHATVVKDSNFREFYSYKPIPESVEEVGEGDAVLHVVKGEKYHLWKNIRQFDYFDLNNQLKDFGYKVEGTETYQLKEWMPKEQRKKNPWETMIREPTDYGCCRIKGRGFEFLTLENLSNNMYENDGRKYYWEKLPEKDYQKIQFLFMNMPSDDINGLHPHLVIYTNEKTGKKFYSPKTFTLEEAKEIMAGNKK